LAAVVEDGAGTLVVVSGLKTKIINWTVVKPLTLCSSPQYRQISSAHQLAIQSVPRLPQKDKEQAQQAEKVCKCYPILWIAGIFSRK
jgi:hypothetical protein